MLTKVYDYAVDADYTKTNTEITAGVVKLAIVPNPGQLFTQNFNSATGFTYDAAKSEFTGGLVRQKDQRAANSVLGATYTSSKNLNWSTAGSLVGTDIGTPTLVGGKLACLGGGNNSVRYESADIGASGNVGAIRVRYTPNYSGTPAANYNIIGFAPAAGNNDLMYLFHSATGTLRLTAYTSVGTLKHSAVVFNAAPWAPVAGTEYELELDWDTVAGTVRLFVDGVLWGSMPVSSYARGSDADRLYIGAGTGYTAADASYNDVLLFSTVQHTSGYVAGYSVPEISYLESTVVLPNFTHPGIGYITALTNLAVTEVGAPRYTIEGQYWNGSAWAASDGTYAQANTLATINANIASMVLTTQTVISVSVVFTSSNTLGSTEDLILTHTHEKYSADGQIETDVTIQAEALQALRETVVNTGNTAVKYVIRINGSLKYWNGSAWAASDGTFAQSSTFANINTNIATLPIPVTNAVIALVANLNTTDETETPELNANEIDYDLGAVISVPNTTVVYGIVRDHSGAGVAATIRFKQLTKAFAEDDDSLISNATISASSDASGGFAVPLTPGNYYVDYFNDDFIVKKTASGAKIQVTVPDAVSINITDLI